MAPKIVCQDCGAEYDSRSELQNIVVNSAVQKTRKICPECESASGTFETVEIEESDE